MTWVAHQDRHRQHGGDMENLGLARMRAVERHQDEIKNTRPHRDGPVDQRQRQMPRKHGAEHCEAGREQLVGQRRGPPDGMRQRIEQEQAERLAVP